MLDIVVSVVVRRPSYVAITDNYKLITIYRKDATCQYKPVHYAVSKALWIYGKIHMPV